MEKDWGVEAKARVAVGTVVAAQEMVEAGVKEALEGATGAR